MTLNTQSPRRAEPLFDAKADAARAFEAVKNGGIAILPHTIGYAAMANSSDALQRIFKTKRRASGKLNAMIGNLEMHRQVHQCSTRGREIVEAITLDYNLPLGCIAPADMSHSLLAGMDADMLERSSKNGTVVMLMNAGECHAHLTKLSLAENLPLFGSSANVSLGGTKFKVEDIEPEIIEIADVVVDHGLQPFHPYAASSTLINVETLELQRKGSCYDDICYILDRHFGVQPV